MGFEVRNAAPMGVRPALAPFLRSCPSIATLGVRTAISDYSPEERTLLRSAPKVFFPTPRFEYLFNALRIPTFPSHASYTFQRSRVLQQVLFSYLNWPHPRTRIYYGRHQKSKILDDFDLPLIVMGPRGIPSERHLVTDAGTLSDYVGRYNPVIIQDACCWRKTLRFLCVNFECVGIAPGCVSKVSHSDCTQLQHQHIDELAALSLEMLRQVDLDDVVIEWGLGQSGWQVLQLARPPLMWCGSNGILNRHRHICELICQGKL